MQFIGDAMFMTRKGIAASIYTALIPGDQTRADVDSTHGGTVVDTDMSGWEDIYDYLDDVEKACATEMMKNHVVAPSIDDLGYELQNSNNGAIIGEASMAWPEKKIVLLVHNNERFKTIFKDQGWKVLLGSKKINSALF